MVLKHKSGDANNPDLPKKSHKVLLMSWNKEKKSYVEVVKINSKIKSYVTWILLLHIVIIALFNY